MQAERDRLLEEVRELRAGVLPQREQVAGLGATGGHLTAQLQEARAELLEARGENRTLQAELLNLARHESKMKR